MQIDEKKLQHLLDPTHTALVVVDKQYGYFRRDSVPTTNLLKIVPDIEDFILLARSKGLSIYWTKMLENINDSPENIRFIMENDDGYTDLTRENEQSFEFFGKVVPAIGEQVIIKKRYNAFAGTFLADDLRSKNIKTVIFVGGYASRCVFASVMGAADNGFYSVVPRELVGNPDKLASEVPVALQIIEFIYGTVLDSGIIKSSWTKRRP